MRFIRLSLLAVSTGLSACAVQAPSPMSSAIPAAEVAPPPISDGVPGVSADARATICGSPFRVGRHRAGAGAAMAMTISNDGGWCARRLTHNGYAFTGGNVVQQPQHGQARIRHLVNRSVIEYRSTPGYVGSDNFSVTMIPGNSTYLVDVEVSPK